MTIGIYALWWADQDIVYIGQSVRIERRFKDHSYRASTNSDSKNLNIVYLTYGEPELVILEKCTISELDNKEIEWISQFDTINTSAGGMGGNFGYNSGKCSASRDDCILVMNLLMNPSLTIKEISDISNVAFRTVESIAYRKRHFWLEEEFPQEYKIATSIKRFSISQERRFNTNVILISPDGTEYLVNNLSKFAKEHNLNKGHICAVARGDERSHKNWKRKEASDA